jgi:polysaccharide export outer membrane protein
MKTPLTLAALAAVALLAGCANQPVPGEPRNTAQFEPPVRGEKVTFLDAEALARFEAETDPVYRLGPGDKLTVDVWKRPELSGEHTVGPDGRISVPLAGTVKLDTMTREEAAGTIGDSLLDFYKRPIVNLRVDEYHANRITVLGRVLTPGVLEFDSQPTLLEALARAGSLPVLDKQATLTRCAVFRGREKIIWVDLKRLLGGGELAYNIRLKPNDLVYIPDSFDTLVYVMGAVEKPGAYRLTPGMTLMDALAQAGGPNEDANEEEIALHRPAAQATDRLSLADLLRAQREVDYTLEEGDVVYVPKRGIANVGYVLEQLLPGLSFITLGAALSGNN